MTSSNEPVDEGHPGELASFSPDGRKPNKKVWGYPIGIGLCPIRSPQS